MVRLGRREDQCGWRFADGSLTTHWLGCVVQVKAESTSGPVGSEVALTEEEVCYAHLLKRSKRQTCAGSSYSPC